MSTEEKLGVAAIPVTIVVAAIGLAGICIKEGRGWWENRHERKHKKAMGIQSYIDNLEKDYDNAFSQSEKDYIRKKIDTLKEKQYKCYTVW